MMKFFRYIIIALAAVSLLSCRGQEDDAALPVLSVNDSEIDLASETQAVFTVTLNGRDVTDASSICSTTSSLELQGNVFTPDRTGSHAFVAEYDGAQSNTVQVNVIDSTPEVVESKYDRHVCVMEFTGGWCINCPEGYDKMKGILAYPQLASYKDNIHLCAFHSNLEEGMISRLPRHRMCSSFLTILPTRLLRQTSVWPVSLQIQACRISVRALKPRSQNIFRIAASLWLQ